MTWLRPPQPGSSGPQVQVLPAGEKSWVCCCTRATDAGAAPPVIGGALASRVQRHTIDVACHPGS